MSGIIPLPLQRSLDCSPRFPVKNTLRKLTSTRTSTLSCERNPYIRTFFCYVYSSISLCKPGASGTLITISYFVFFFLHTFLQNYILCIFPINAYVLAPPTPLFLITPRHFLQQTLSLRPRPDHKTLQPLDLLAPCGHPPVTGAFFPSLGSLLPSISNPFFQMNLLLTVLVSLLAAVSAGEHNTVNTWGGVLQYDEDWGYVDIRANAHTFWWLYAVKPVDPKRPLFVWLQGGPGSSSSGFGNFEETGPKTLNGTDNPATWLQVADMVYVDNPVGAGFSYVDDKSAYTTEITQIGKDLLAWLRRFLALHSEYRTRPFYIFCESYGGKMSAQFAKVITDVSSWRWF